MKDWGEMVDIKEELERLIERISAHRLRLRSQSERPAPKFEKGEAGVAQAILAAQQRAADKTPTTNKKPPILRRKRGQPSPVGLFLFARPMLVERVARSLVNHHTAFLGNNQAFLQRSQDMFARSYQRTASMTRRDRELLNKQFRRLNRRPSADGLFVLSIASVLLICLLLGSAGIA
jgi:hypothetical protein